MEEGLFIQICLITVALAFLETAVVKRVEFLGHRSLQILKGAEHFIPEPGDDRCRDLANGSFYKCFLFGFTDVRRHDGSLVMDAKGFIVCC